MSGNGGGINLPLGSSACTSADHLKEAAFLLSKGGRLAHEFSLQEGETGFNPFVLLGLGATPRPT